MHKLFYLLAVVALITSCIGYEEPQFSPQIYGSSFFVNPVFDGDSIISAKDTLSMIYDADDDSYELDTVYIGDTVVFAATFYTVTSNLMSIEIKWEKDFMDLWYPLTEDVMNVLTDNSEPENGKLCFDSGYNRVSFPIYFTPKVRGGMTLKLSVESDSSFPVSSVLMYIPAIEEPVAKEDEETKS